jgi:hypothetical protein
MNIGIVILATNAYFVLGIRFIKKFIHHYKGDKQITFYFFSDTDPKPYTSDNIDVKFFETYHSSWVEGTNDKFKSILSLSNCKSNYLYYFDADTNVSKDFTEDWFLNDLVGGEHYGNRSWLKNGAGFDRNPISKAYVPESSLLPYTYHYGAFFGGKKDCVVDFCTTLREWQLEDKKIPYEPGCNDESYINTYFHFNPPYTVSCEDFAFDISDKGGIEGTRNTSLDIQFFKNEIIKEKNKLFDIRHNTITWINYDN